MRCVEQMRAGVVQHRSPTRGGRRHTQAQETHGRFRQNCARHADCGLHNHGLNNIWKDVAQDDAQVAGAKCTRCFDEFSFTHGQHLAAHQARVANPASKRESEHEIENSRAAEGDEGDRDEDSGERKKRIHQDDVDEAVDASSVISGKRADDESKEQRAGDDARADEHGNARSPDEAGEDVASEFVGTAEMMRRRSLEAVRKIDVGGVLRGDPRREERAEHEEDDERDSDGRQGIVAGEASASLQLPVAGCQVPVGRHLR